MEISFSLASYITASVICIRRLGQVVSVSEGIVNMALIESQLEDAEKQTQVEVWFSVRSSYSVIAFDKNLEGNYETY